MAGLEVVVRPVVFPNIRPAPARSLPPADDPEKGFAVIRGNGAKQIDLTNSYSSSASTSIQTETKRRVDVARVFQKKDDGTVNKDNFVDMEVANKIWMKGPAAPGYDPEKDPKNAGTVALKDLTNEQLVQYYARVKKQDNIEIKKRNIMKPNDNRGSGGDDGGGE